jgi:MFS family permease
MATFRLSRVKEDLVDRLVSTFAVFLVQFPVVLVWLIGLVLSLVYWRRHPKVSLLTFIAIAGLLVSSLIGTYLSVWLPVTLQERGWSANQIGTVIAARGIIGSLIAAVLWGLLIAAIFGWRSKQGEVPRNGG